ncbi:DUF1700 domain-containing protein [Pseudobdellovibrio exovorus]|uniref:DUF1700 domain-containing protein n=1 Tax=Pseudobdellovibrio exovorus JSS TaxID=1184267 RepID=M4VB25_9BACT|nr:DUF1700 domain-containing protein [Pseudobdellovibrio exovorus]AGH96418.1 hypothetical protein A11Q_2202 [Pseudobdellovibrio exovorus JSS]
MNRQEYIKQLRTALNGLPQFEIDDIIRDQEEMITDAISSGRSEESVIQAMGSATELARTLKAELRIDQAVEERQLSKKLKGVFGALGALLVLAPFNLIFILGPFLLVLGVVFSGWILATAIGLGAIGLLGLFFTEALSLGAGLWVNLSLFFGIFSVIGISLLGILWMYFITQWLIKMILSYFKWNLNFIKSRV